MSKYKKEIVGIYFLFFSIFILISLFDYQIIKTNNNFSHLKDTQLFPIAITLPETLMNSWSFRGALFEWQSPNEMKDLVPVDSSEISSTTKLRRQKDEVRTLLYNDFFNASDKAFTDCNSNGALSTNVSVHEFS